MAHYVPRLEWSERALKARQFIFDYWAEHGHGPNLRRAHEGTGLSRRDLTQAYKELQTGIVMVVDQDSPNCDILKIPPYSSFPSQVEMYIDDKFHSFIGCAHEAVAVSKMPHFEGKECRLETYCACCLEPIWFTSKEFVVQERSHPNPLVHWSSTVWEWVNNDCKSMCDHVNAVIDADHALEFEKQIGRRGILFTLDQVATFVEPAIGVRGWDYHWPSISMNPEGLIAHFQSMGIDLSPWGL